MSTKPKDKQKLIQWGQDFKAHFGYFPSRNDLRAPLRTAFIKHYSYKMEHATTIVRLFGSWGDYRIACGEVASIYTPTDVAEDISMAYMVHKYKMIPNQAEQGIVDGYIGDKQVEVKGAVLRAPNSAHRFRWILHNRVYSNLVDEMYLIGIDANSEVKVEICIPTTADLAMYIDNKNYVELSALSLKKGYTTNPLWNFVVAYSPISEDK